MKVSDKAYIAGIIDGEGSISIVRRTDEDRFIGRIYIGQGVKGLSVLNFIKDRFGGCLYEYKASKATNGSMYRWIATDAKAKKIALKVVPFLLIKREQARILIALQTIKRRFHRTAAGRDSSFRGLLEDFYQNCKISIQTLNGHPPAETKREDILDADSIWLYAHKILSLQG